MRCTVYDQQAQRLAEATCDPGADQVRVVVEELHRPHPAPSATVLLVDERDRTYRGEVRTVTPVMGQDGCSPGAVYEVAAVAVIAPTARRG